MTVYAINGTVIDEGPTHATDRIEFFISIEHQRVRVYYQKWGAKALPISMGMEIPVDIWLKIADVLEGHEPDFGDNVIVTDSDGPEYVFPSNKKRKKTPTVTPPESIKQPKKKQALKKKRAVKKAAPKLRIG